MAHWSDKAPFSDELKRLLRESPIKQVPVIIEVRYTKYSPDYQKAIFWFCGNKFSALASENSLAKMVGDKNIVRVELAPQFNAR